MPKNWTEYIGIQGKKNFVAPRIIINFEKKFRALLSLSFLYIKYKSLGTSNIFNQM